MCLIKAISTLISCITSKQEHAKCISTFNTAMLHSMEKHVPGFKAAMETFDSDIIVLQTIIDMLKVIEMGFTKDKDKKRKLDKSVDSITDMAKIRQELDEAWNENEILKLKLEQLKVEQSLQTDCRRELRESQSENDELKYELKCSKLEPSGIMGNTFTSMTIRLLTIGKCANTSNKWKRCEIRTLILAIQLPFLSVHFIQCHCLPCKFLECCPSHDHPYLILTFFFFRSFFECNQHNEL